MKLSRVRCIIILLTALCCGCAVFGKNKEEQPFNPALIDKLVPGQVLELEGKNLILYERTLYRGNALTLGIPVMGDIGGPSADLSARGGLVRYDTLALFFTPDDILCNIVFEEGSHRPYLKTLLSDTRK